MPLGFFLLALFFFCWFVCECGFGVIFIFICYFFILIYLLIKYDKI